MSAEARSCPGKQAEHTFTLRPVGFRDSLEVGVTYSCRCGCSTGLEPDSARCSGNGTYVCGLCDCNPSYLGTRCECQEGESQSGYQNLCREAEGKPLCSGRGECSCNQCSCFESEFGKIYGAFCQCDNFSCARNRGVLCSGRHPTSTVVLSQARAPLGHPPPKVCLLLTAAVLLGEGEGKPCLPPGWGGDQCVEHNGRRRTSQVHVDSQGHSVCCESSRTSCTAFLMGRCSVSSGLPSETGSSLGPVVVIPLLDMAFIACCCSDKFLQT